MSISDINRIFEQLYNEYIGYISHYCYYKLSDYPEYAQDCIQDTFRVLFEKLSENVEIEYPKAFLIKTASNFVKLKYRDIDKEKNRHISIDYPTAKKSFFQKYAGIMRIRIKRQNN